MATRRLGVPGCRSEGGGSRAVAGAWRWGRLTRPLALMTWWKATGGLVLMVYAGCGEDAAGDDAAGGALSQFARL